MANSEQRAIKDLLGIFAGDPQGLDVGPGGQDHRPGL